MNMISICSLWYLPPTLITLNGNEGLLSRANEKAKTSINIDKQTWQDWIKFVVNRTGSARKISDELEKALQEYMKKHSKE